MTPGLGRAVEACCEDSAINFDVTCCARHKARGAIFVSIGSPRIDSKMPTNSREGPWKLVNVIARKSKSL